MELALRDSVTVNAPAGADNTVLDGAGSQSILYVTGNDVDVNIGGLSLQNGSASACVLGSKYLIGGAICCLGGTSTTLTISDGNVLDSSAPMGGLVFSDSCDVTMERTTLSGGAAYFGGMAFVSSGSLTLTDSVVTGNLADYSGGAGYVGLLDSAHVVLDGTTVSGNEATFGGGWFMDDSATDSSGRPAGNSVRCRASTKGTGGVYDNTASEGGGVLIWSQGWPSPADTLRSNGL